MAPNVKDNITQKGGLIYRYRCDRLECDQEYIGESARTFGERLKEHLRDPSPIYDHANTMGHHTKVDIFSIVGREYHNIARTTKEGIHSGVRDPLLNRNIGNFQMSLIWVEVLFNTPELKLK